MSYADGDLLKQADPQQGIKRIHIFPGGLQSFQGLLLTPLEAWSFQEFEQYSNRENVQQKQQVATMPPKPTWDNSEARRACATPDSMASSVVLGSMVVPTKGGRSPGVAGRHSFVFDSETKDLRCSMDFNNPCSARSSLLRNNSSKDAKESWTAWCLWEDAVVTGGGPGGLPDSTSMGCLGGLLSVFLGLLWWVWFPPSFFEGDNGMAVILFRLLRRNVAVILMVAVDRYVFEVSQCQSVLGRCSSIGGWMHTKNILVYGWRVVWKKVRNEWIICQKLGPILGGEPKRWNASTGYNYRSNAYSFGVIWRSRLEEITTKIDRGLLLYGWLIVFRLFSCHVSHYDFDGYIFPDRTIFWLVEFSQEWVEMRSVRLKLTVKLSTKAHLFRLSFK